MKESSQTTIHLHEDEEHAEHFGAFMYPGAEPMASEENVDALLHLAVKFQTQVTVNPARQAFLLIVPCGELSRELLLRAHRFGLRKLMAQHARWFGQNPDLWESLEARRDPDRAICNICHPLRDRGGSQT